MRSLSIIVRGAMGIALLLSVMALPASAAPSGADRMLAAGAGAAFTDVGPATGQRAAECWEDPADDVVDLEDDLSSIDEPRGDIVEHCANHGISSVTLQATMDEPTDPSADINWAASLLGWFIDTDDDGEGEFFVQVSQDEGGDIAATVEDRRGEGAAETACDGLYFSYEDGAITARFGRDCIDNPDTIAVSPGMIYDQRVEDVNGHATFDRAPEDGEFDGDLPAGALTEPGVNRVDGDERIESAVLGSQAAYGDGEAMAVILARADVPADAQAGTPLAIASDGPLLLSATNGLSERTATEIQRVLPEGGTVALLGGENALGADVVTDIEALGYTAVRYGGENRFATAVAIATDGLDSPVTAILADGATFGDAIVAGAASYAIANQPAFSQELPEPGSLLDPDSSPVGAVLLTDGERMPDETQAYLDTANPANIATVGQAATAATDEEDVAYAGDTDAATSVMVAEAVFESPTIAGIATASDFADALFGGALVGDPDVGPGPMLLTDPTTLSSEVEAYLSDNADSIETIVIFGGTNAVSPAVEDAIVATQE